MLDRFWMIGHTVWRLGLPNVAAVAWYRLTSRLGLLAAKSRPVDPAAFGLETSTESPPPRVDSAALFGEADAFLKGTLRGLGDNLLPIGNEPEWNRSLLTGCVSRFDGPWWQAVDFDPELGDVKGVWEASRFDWALLLVRASRMGHGLALQRLNSLVADWRLKNPPYRGLNWRCGQETSLRLMQTLLACRLLDPNLHNQAVVTFVDIHLRRILPSRWYAMAQDNDHGFSEALAMFGGGGWLARHGAGASARLGRRSARIGRAWLENQVRRLILNDGGSAPYSINYHRFILDTLSHAELWRRWLEAAPFSREFYRRVGLATEFLAKIVNSANGDAPNIGANDGVRAYRLDSLAYRDHRPSVQLAAALFLGRRAYREGPWDEPLAWIKLSDGAFDPLLSAKSSMVFPQFGLALIAPTPSGAYGFLRVPNNRFRPPQADPLHFDLWTAEGVNLLRDAGSCSYSDDDVSRRFAGISSHNTVQFDGAEPMPRISRFLFAHWLRATLEWSPTSGRWSASYRGARGAIHRRTITLQSNVWLIEDRIEGFQNEATLRWRLAPGAWALSGSTLSGQGVTLSIASDLPPRALRLTSGQESRAYASASPVQVLEVIVIPQSHWLSTRIEFLAP